MHATYKVEHPIGIELDFWKYKQFGWFGLWCLTPLSIIFQLYRGTQFYWWREIEYSQKTAKL